MKFFAHLVLCGIAVALAGCASTPPNATPAEREQAATLALLCADVIDLRRAQVENPGPEPVAPKWTHFASKEDGGTWEIVGYLNAADELAFMGHLAPYRPKRVVFGVLARETAHPDNYVVIIRGTRWIVEWLKDGEIALDPTSWGFGVLAHRSFYGIYQSMRYQPKGGKAEDKPAWRAVLEATQGKPLTVAGHGIGAPLAAFLMLDMAKEREDVVGRYFASPHPGNGELVDMVAKRLDNYVVYDNAGDRVTSVPKGGFGVSFQPLGRIDRIEPRNETLKLDGDVQCQHNAISYAALLNPALMSVEKWQERLAQSRQAKKCIVAADPG